MTTSIINRFYYSDSLLSNFITNETYFQRGFYAVCFSNMATNSAPAIQANSIIEIDGNLYEFNANESITGTPSGVCYVKCYLSAGALVAEYTSIAPTFNALKNGWYGTGANETHRYILKLYYSSTNYQYKQIMNKEVYW
jgi:hypothetical protein